MLRSIHSGTEPGGCVAEDLLQIVHVDSLKGIYDIYDMCKK